MYKNKVDKYINKMQYGASASSQSNNTSLELELKNILERSIY